MTILYILLSHFHFHQVWIKFGTEDVLKTLNDCGFREYRRSDMHTKGLNEFLSVFSTFISTFIFRLTEDRDYDVQLRLLSIRKMRENGRWEAHISRA